MMASPSRLRLACCVWALLFIIASVAAQSVEQQCVAENVPFPEDSCVENVGTRAPQCKHFTHMKKKRQSTVGLKIIITVLRIQKDKKTHSVSYQMHARSTQIRTLCTRRQVASQSPHAHLYNDSKNETIKLHTNHQTHAPNLFFCPLVLNHHAQLVHVQCPLAKTCLKNEPARITEDVSDLLLPFAMCM
jgi:hypothetical protein